MKGANKKNTLSQVPKRGARPRGDSSLSAMPPPPQKNKKIRNTSTNFSAIGLCCTALRSKWTEGGGAEGCALNEKINRPKPVACGLWFPKGVSQPGPRFTRVLYYPFLANHILPISYPSYPSPAGSQFARAKTQMGTLLHGHDKAHLGNYRLRKQAPVRVHCATQ